MDFEALPFDPRREVEIVCNTNRPAASKRGLSLRVSLAERLPAVLIGDAMQLRQVLNNLINNSIKFSEAGCIDVVGDLDAAAAANPLSCQVRFAVRDQGKGIDSEDLKKLFMPFSQVDSTISRRFGGTGPGLSICRALVEGMGGTIGVTSREGSGSEFFFSVPFMPGSRLEKDTRPQIAFAPLDGSVMLVDDNVVNQTFIAFMLKKMGLRVTVAVNGKVAFDLAQNKSFDAVIMDCHMPEMDGLEATRRIREWEAQEGLRRLPIIALTANAMPGEKEKCLQGGMDAFLSKPVAFESLYEMLARHLI